MGRMSPGSWISFLPIGLALVASYIGGLFGAWAWAITVLGVAFTMRRSNGPVIPAPVPPSRIVIGAIVSFVLGAGIRLWQLDKFPPFFFDEAVLAYDARCVLGGRPLEPMDVSYFYRSPSGLPFHRPQLRCWGIPYSLCAFFPYCWARSRAWRHSLSAPGSGIQRRA